MKKGRKCTDLLFSTFFVEQSSVQAALQVIVIIRQVGVLIIRTDNQSMEIVYKQFVEVVYKNLGKLVTSNLQAFKKKKKEWPSSNKNRFVKY